MANYNVVVTLTGKDNLSPQLKTVNTELDNLEKGGSKAKDSTSALDDVFGKLAATFSLAKVAETAVQMYNLGTAANNAEVTFTQLSGGASEATANLDAMRKATGGTVDDMTLMQGANKLLLMNLAATGEEAAGLTEIAVKLGRAMGNDAASSIGDFAALLANQSIPRLDNFGVSSDAVRKRVDELKEAGYGAQEAFSMAVMEEGRKSLERLGATADGTGAAFDRFGTDVTNKVQDVSQGFAEGVNGLIGIAEYALGQNPAQIALREMQALNEADLQAYFDQQGDVLRGAAESMDLQVREDFNPADTLKRLYSQAASDINSGYFSTEAEALNNAVSVIVDDMVWAGEITEDQRAQWESTLTDMFTMKPPQEAFVATQQYTRDYWDAYGSYWTEQAQKTSQRTAEEWKKIEAEAGAERTLRFRSQSIFESTGLDANMSDLMTQAQVAAMMPDYMTQAAADSIKTQYEAAASELENLKQLNKDGLIPTDLVTQAETMTKNVKQMADEAARAADAFDRLKLSDLFGQGNGGVRGQVSDAVLAKMKANGASPEAIAAMENELNLMSGRETGASQFFKNTVATAMAELPADQAASVADGFSSLMEQAALQGLDPAAVQKVQERFMQAIFPEGGFDTSAMGGFDPLKFLLGSGDSEGTAAGDDAATDLSIKTGDISSNMETINANTQEFASTLLDLASKIINVKLKLDVDAGAFKALLTQLGINVDGVAGTNPRDNGGRVKGTDSRVTPER